MRKVFRLFSIITICCALFPVISGCGNKADDSAQMPATPAVNGNPVPTAGSPGSVPSNNGGTPPATGAPANGTPAATPTASNQDASAPISLAQAAKSPIKRTTVTKDETKIVTLSFKYEDWEGNTCQCELPAAEGQGTKTASAWQAVFDIYKKDIPVVKKVKKKAEVKRLNDFPFVSPPPAAKQKKQESGTSAPTTSQTPQSSNYYANHARNPLGL